MREWLKPVRHHPGHRFWWADVSSAALALLLATVVWVVAIYEQDPPRTDPFEGIPIKYTNIRDDLVLVGPATDQAALQVRAPTSHLASQAVSPSVLEATADLAGLGEGVHNVDVKAQSLDKTALVVGCSPARVVVRLEERVRREFDVRAELVDPDSVPPGYATAPPTASPERATVVGPRSLVDQVTAVVARVWLRGSKQALENPVALVALDANGEAVGGVDITPTSVTVRVGVESLAEFRDVSVRAIVPGSPAPGYWVSNITVEPAAVTVQGRPEIIRQMASVVETAPVDVTGATTSFGRRVSLNLPEGVTVYSADTSARTVLVRVEVTPIVGGKTVQPKVQWVGLRSGNVLHITPDTVDVILSGPMPELQALQIEDVRVEVSLFGMGPGRYRLVPTVLLPDGSNLKVERMAPDAVEVIITEAPEGTPTP